MATITLRLHVERLRNPDLDLLYRIPELVEARGNGVVFGDGYDYTHYDPDGEPADLLLFFLTEDVDAALAVIRNVLGTETVCGNDNLSDAISLSVEP